MSSSFPLALKPPLHLFLHHHQKPHALFPLSKTSPLPFSSQSKSHLCFSSSPSNPNLPGLGQDDNFHWLREEQRWLREEQRWLREEQRWLRERDSLLTQIQSLKLQIQNLEALILSKTQDNPPLQDTVAKFVDLLELLKEKENDKSTSSGNLIAGSGSGAKPILLNMADKEKVVSVSSEGKAKEKRTTLRKGCEGEEVRKMQEALQRLGFYSGEEDLEYSSFSSGTERAVKTWQATFGTREDGIMTAELLERLYTEQQIQSPRTSIGTNQNGSTQTVPPEEGSNVAAVTSATEISEIQKKVVKEEGIKEVEVSEHRVFLLGENRWEEPSRLVSRDKLDGGSKAKVTVTKCLTCRGEGRLMCTECDGTGEPNIEPQFMEWVGEGTKCPYCEGLGFITCDVCEGKT